MTRRDLARDSYNRVARIYDLLGQIYSGGQIRSCKSSFLGQIRPGDRVLFAGAGTGEDVVYAARRGASVVAVEISGNMVERLRERMTSRDAIEIVQADILTVDRPHRFDWVVANFFLNVFRSRDLGRVICHLEQLLDEDGVLVIGDFAPPVGGGIGRLLQELHHFVPLLVFWMLTRTPLHRLHDYHGHLQQAGLVLADARFHRAFGRGPRWYVSLVARRAQQRPADG